MKRRTKILGIVFILLLAGGLLSAYISFQPYTHESVAESIGAEVKKELELASTKLNEVIAAIDSPATISHLKRYPFFVYSRDSLLYWSDNHYVPTPRIVSDTFQVKLLKTGNGAFLAMKKQAGPRRYVVTLITLQRDYFINNDYLTPEWSAARSCALPR